MSKIICDICGTEYDDSVGSCPVCGWDQNGDLPDDIGDFDSDFLDDLQTDIPVPGAAPVKPVAPKIPSAAPKAKTAFDYDAANARTRPAPKKPAPAVEDEDDDEDEEEESGSNTFLIIILVLLILALLAVSAYIGWTKIIKPRQAGSNDNKPTETITAQVNETTDPTQVTTEYVEETEPGVPCTGLSLVGSMEKLTFKGQYWRLMVKAEPEDTTDKVVYTSGDESIVTIDEYGRVTAVGEGETTIVVTCGNERLETPAVVSFQTETTEAATETTAAAEGAATTPTAAGGNVGTGSGTAAGSVLKLKKTDVTISRRGVYITLELEGGIVADDVKWSTSDSSVATVYNGNVTAIGKGTCIITAEYNGQTAQCIVRCKF